MCGWAPLTLDVGTLWSRPRTPAGRLGAGARLDGDRVVEEPTDGATFYADADGDGAGDAASPIVACEAPEGYVADATDCDDAEPRAFPGNPEVCDEIDDDCDGEVDDDASDVVAFYADGDGDGYGDASQSVTDCAAPDGYTADDTDCDDADPSVHPDAEEADCADPVDYNCDGSVGYADADADGSPACEDCDDAAADRRPGLAEVCDAADTDEDCNGSADDDDAGVTDAITWSRDADGDGYAGASGPTVTACDAPTGYVAATGDCDDYDNAVSPAATEVCDGGADDDCDGLADDADPSTDPATWSTWSRDGDGDSYGDASRTVTQCAAPSGYVADGTDCDDADAARNPGEAEVCDASDRDEDCDALADDADPSVTGGTTRYADADGDGYGDPATAVVTCDATAGYVTDATDCADGTAARNPGAVEVCDAADVDEDCDGLADDADSSVTGRSTWYRDADGDGYAPASAATRASCERPAGYASATGDCDDLDSAVSPAATEVCDPLDADEDCDGVADDADGDVDAATWSTFYRDGDGDGYGDATHTIVLCDATAGYGTDASDCDDSRAAISPAGTEVCDAADADEDCDGLADDADPGVTGTTTWYGDADGDGYGTPSPTRSACARPSGYAPSSTDCDDAAVAVHPGGTEVCDATDDDCDGLVDDSDPGVTGTSTWYADTDGDGYGTSASTQAACAASAGYVANSTDCDDGRAAVSPAGTETCATSYDDDCDGVTDEEDAAACVTWYADADADGYGGTASECWCEATGGYTVATSTDCDDASSSIHPGATETCRDGIDEDCDGSDTACVATNDLAPAGDYLDSEMVDTLTGSSGTSEGCGDGLAGGGDVNGDGNDDLLVGCSYYSYTSSRRPRASPRPTPPSRGRRAATARAGRSLGAATSTPTATTTPSSARRSTTARPRTAARSTS